jgi:hypothetical protein
VSTISYATEAIQRAKDSKARLDAFINKFASGRLSYLLKSDNVYSKVVHVLRQSGDTENLRLVMKHRFYFEIRAREVR